MKVIVFGTGTYCKNFILYIRRFEILCFLDNDQNKWGEIYEGVPVLKPEDADFSACDYVLILIMRYKSVKDQLTALSVPDEKIKCYFDISDITNVDPEVCLYNERVTFPKWIERADRERVFLLAHELTRNGVSVVLMHTARLLQNMGYSVVISGLIGGGLELELKEEGIPYISNVSMCYRSKRFKSCYRKLSFSIFGAVGVADAVESLADTDVPIIWWLHESNNDNYRDFLVPKRKNIFYYGGGKRVLNLFKSYYWDRNIEELLYFLPDDSIENEKDDIYRIAVIGAINYRKAQNIFIEAVEMLGKDIKRGVEFDLIGAFVEPVIDMDMVLKKNTEVKYLGELSQIELKQYYGRLDVLVCCSRDDPMPVVVTQAMQYGILCIVSDQVGQSEYITDGKNGYIFQSDDVGKLSEIISYCINNKLKAQAVGRQGMDIFNNYFSEMIMRQKLDQIIRRITAREG